MKVGMTMATMMTMTMAMMIRIDTHADIVEIID